MQALMWSLKEWKPLSRGSGSEVKQAPHKEFCTTRVPPRIRVKKWNYVAKNNSHGNGQCWFTND